MKQTITIAPLRNEEEHRDALREAEALFTALPGTPDFDKLHCLVDAIQAYERAIFILPFPSQEAKAEYERAKRGEVLVPA